MQYFHFRFLARAWFAAILAFALVSCGGGGGNSGSTTNTTLGSPLSTQAAIQELMNAFAATLTGAQEVPQRPSGATGSGTVVINPATRQMTATLTTTNIVGTAAHIHQAPAGTNGPIIFPLTETGPGSGIWSTAATLTEAQHNAFKAGDFYFNVHSTAFPDGEIRGQISAQVTGSTGATGVTGTGTSGLGATAPGATGTAGTGLFPGVTSNATFISALRGAQEVPPTSSTAQGSGTLLINPSTRQLTAAVTTVGIAATDAHIHEAAPGVNGPIIVPLTQTTPGSGVWIARATLTEAQFNALQNVNLYFNVHSAAFPLGEIRGQILPQKVPAPLVTGAAGGTGTPGTTGTAGTPLTGIPLGSGTTGTTTGTGMSADTTGTGLTGLIGTTGTTGTGTGSQGTDTAGLRY